MSTLIEQIAQFSTDTTYDRLPAEVAGEARRLLLDSVGCALGGLRIDKGQKAVDIARAMPGPAEATVFGAGDKLPMASAVFANGELINTLDFDSLITPPGHVVPYVIPAIFASAEANGRSGKDLITAIAVAHEVSLRFGRSMGYYRDVAPGKKLSLPAITGFSSTIFGGTLGSAMMAGLDTATTAHALGLAGHIAPVQTLGKWGRTSPGSDQKYQNSGWIGQAELMAVLMAEKGYHGDVEALDGDYGFWKFIGASGWKPEALSNGLGETWGFPEVTIYKPWPHCRNSNTVLDCLSDILAETGLQPDEIESIDTYWDAHTATEPLWTTKQINNCNDAQMSTAYAVSMVVHGVPASPVWYSNDVLANETYLKFLDRITMHPHPKYEETLLAEPHSRIGSVVVKARGQVFEKEQTYRKGSPATPETRMSDDELAAKFCMNAEGVMAADKAEQMAAQFLKLETIGDLSEIVALW